MHAYKTGMCKKRTVGRVQTDKHAYNGTVATQAVNANMLVWMHRRTSSFASISKKNRHWGWLKCAAYFGSRQYYGHHIIHNCVL